MSGEHPNLSLARDLVCRFVEHEICIHQATQNAHLMTRLDLGGAEDLKPLPGVDLIEICDNLQTVLRLASEPVELPASGRNREATQWASQRQRERIKLYSRVCLVLLGASPVTR